MNTMFTDLKNKYHRDDFEILSFEKRTYPMKIKCLNCGYTWTVDRANRLLDKTRKNLCPNCYQKAEPKKSDKSMEYQHKFDYWYKTIGNKKYDIIENYTYYSRKIKIKCKKCGAITSRSIESLLKKSECLACELKHSVPKTNQFFVQQVKELEGEDYSVLTPYKNAHTKLKIRHNTCGFIYETTPHNFLSRGRRCPKCGKTESKGEDKIKKFLINNNLIFISQKRFEEYKRYSFDFFIPTHNLLIEYNGIQHYQSIDFFGGEPSFISQQKRDNIKKLIAEEYGYTLLIISYLEHENIHNILNHIFFQNSTTIRKE